jgi:hypothetical protein
MKDKPQHFANPVSPNNKVLEYITPHTLKLNLPFILTMDNKLTLDMPYMMLEGEKSLAINLHDFWDYEDVVYLKIQDLTTEKIYTISWNLMYSGDFWLWSLADFDYLMNLSKIAN